MSDPGKAFLDESRRYLRDEYPVKIARALERLSEDDLWWRPNEASNSIGNLMLHLAGNVRQWIATGIGGAPDIRHRGAEFTERGPLPRAELFSRLHDALDAADAVLARLGTDDLSSYRIIQERRVTVLDALYHVVEHFSMHTGQILFIAKMRTGAGLGFYAEDPEGNARSLWQRRANAAE